MNFTQKFIECFLSDYSQTFIYENDKEYHCEFSSINYVPKDILFIESAYDFLQTNDKLTFSIIFGEADPVYFYSNNLDFSDFKNRLDTEHDYQDGEEIKAVFEITKNNNEGNVSIYDLDVFASTIEQLSIAQSFVIFNRLLFEKSFINFNVLNLKKPFNTANVFFTPVGFTPLNQPISDRIKKLENIRSVSYYTSIEAHRLTPDDFEIVSEEEVNNKIHRLFTKYSLVLSIIYLFDITTLTENTLEFKINGYKSIKGKIDFKTNSISEINDYLKIYRWVYSGGNLNDKIGLARNIISLHFEKSGEIELKGDAYNSIQSSYKVYEKQNIKQYIEIRNKISDQLLDFNNRANKVIETFASGFQKSALALISFYTSAIVVRVLGKGEFINVFTLDATVLSIVFLAGSFIYYKVSRWEVLEQKKRFVNSYSNLKERYTDLLEPEDIKRILNNDKEYNADVGFIDDKLKNYSRMWRWLLGLLLFATLFLFLVYNISKIFDTAIWKLIFNKNCNC